MMTKSTKREYIVSLRNLIFWSLIVQWLVSYLHLKSTIFILNCKSLDMLHCWKSVNDDLPLNNHTPVSSFYLHHVLFYHPQGIPFRFQVEVPFVGNLHKYQLKFDILNKETNFCTEKIRGYCILYKERIYSLRKRMHLLRFSLYLYSIDHTNIWFEN